MGSPLLRLNHKVIKHRMLQGGAYKEYTLRIAERRIIHILLSGRPCVEDGFVLCVGDMGKVQGLKFWNDANSTKFLKPFPDGVIPWSIVYG